MQNPIALICSVELELTPVVTRMEGRRTFSCGGRPAWTGRIGPAECIALAGGMGKTNAAQAATALLERTTVSALVGFGVGGAYHRSGLKVGDLAVATAEVYGDEGVETPTGWLSCEGIGIPLLQTGSQRHFNEFPVDAELTELLARGAGSTRRPERGPFVTVSCCSGTRSRGDRLAGSFGAICETMEGAAYAHIAALYEVPFGEIRGISNLVSDRDTSTWRLREAAQAAADAVVAAVELFPDGTPRAALPTGDPDAAQPDSSSPNTTQRRKSGRGR